MLFARSDYLKTGPQNCHEDKKCDFHEAGVKCDSPQESFLLDLGAVSALGVIPRNQ